MSTDDADAVVVGSGPNGLAAAIELARAGLSVLVCEAHERPGGGMRTAALTEPGFRHDVCSAAHPLAVASPFLRSLDLASLGVELLHPPAPLAHPLDGGRAAVLERSVAATGDTLGADADRWARLVGPVADGFDALLADVLGPLRPPRDPLRLARFGLPALLPATWLARAAFSGEAAPALFAGAASHAQLSLRAPATSSFGLILAAAGHAVGWPVVRGGSERLAEAMVRRAQGLGVRVETGRRVARLEDLPSAPLVLWDTTPAQFLEAAGDRVGAARQLRRFRRGPGAFKVDWALDGPVPWAAEGCARAGTVHVGGPIEEVAAAEEAVARGRHPERPFVLVVQPSVVDETRAPAGKHAVWGYCHVPNGSKVDMTSRIEAQIERFAPGFRDRVLARSVLPPSALEAYNPNYLGGDINGGAQDLGQLFTRPRVAWDPYRLPLPGHFLCSSSTPPGGGVHGMCGAWAARSALRRWSREHP